TDDEWNIGTLAPYEDGSVTIGGTFYSDIGGDVSMRAFMNYEPENFSSSFQSVWALPIRVTSAPLTVSIGAKPEITRGSTGDIVIRVAPVFDSAVRDLAVILDYSDAFVQKSATPAAGTKKSNQWNITELNKDQEIKVSGLFVGEPNVDTMPLSVTVRGWSDSTRTGDGFVYATVTTSVRLTDTAVTASLAINGTDSDATVRSGDILSGSIQVKNNGNTPESNVVVRAVFDAPSVNRQSILKWADLADAKDGNVVGEQLRPDTRRGTITWDAAKIPELSRLDPGETVTIDWQLPIKNNTETELADFSTAIIQATADVQFGAGASRQIISANPITFTLVSDAKLEVRDSLGRNAQGQETHAISWILTNAFHDLASTTLSADFYGDVSIDTKSMNVPAGTASFDTAKKRLTWTIDRLPTSLDTAALQFTVVLNSKNPTQTQLAGKVSGQAVDTVAGEEIVLVGEEIGLR
ncbi:MAG: hypothetical protein AAB408_03800, partial [Patescibacteria group bacterium]